MASDPTRPGVTSRHVAKGVGTTMLARLGGVIDVVAQPLYVWLFGLASFGLYTVLWAAVNLIENVADLGMTSAMQRTVPQARDEAAAAASLRTALLLGVGPCLAIAAVVAAIAPIIAPAFHVAPKDQALLVPAIRLFVWALPLWAFVEIATSALRARRLFGPEIRIRLLWEQVVRLILAVGFWTAGLGIAGLLLAHLLSLTITCGLALRLLARHYDLRLLFRRGQREMAAATVKAGLSVLPTNIVAQIFTDGPPVLLNLVIPGAAGATASALFGIARKVASIIQLFRTAFAYVLAPLASAATRGAPGEVQSLYAYTTRLTSALVVPMACVMAAGSPAILRLFGPGAEVARPALVILLFARMAEAASGAAKPVQQVVSGYGQQVLASAVGLAVAAAIGAFTVPAYALTGMAVAVSIGLVATALIPVWQLRRNDGLHPFDAQFVPVFARAAAVALLGTLLALLANAAPLWLQLPLLVAVLLAALWLALRFALPPTDRLTLGRNTARRLRLV